MNEPRSTPPSADDEPDRDTVWLLPEGAGDALAEWCGRLVQEARENGGRVPSLRRMTKKG